MNAESSPRPAPNMICPLCGGPNDCAPARCGNFDTPCWCSSATFAPGLLERVPEASRGVSCICPACAAAAQAQHTQGKTVAASSAASGQALANTPVAAQSKSATDLKR